MKLSMEWTIPGSARVSRVGDRVLAITDFLCEALLKERLFWRDAKTSTRGPSRTGVACATRASANGPASINRT